MPIKTKSELYLSKRSNAPTLSGKAIVSLSQRRRETLQEQFEKGEFSGHGFEKNSNVNSQVDQQELTSFGNILKSSTPFYKSASLYDSSNTTTGSSGYNYRGTGGTVRQIPEIYSPLWLLSNLNMPRDRATINAWCRAYIALNPVVNNAVTLHSTYPLSKFNITCHDKKVENFIGEMCDNLDVQNIAIQIAQEYWGIGEAVVYSQFDESLGVWSKILLQNPDYVVIQYSPLAGEPIISLRPDEMLRRIVTSNKPSDVLQRKMLDPAIVDFVKKGQNIPLDNFYVSHIARKLNPQDLRGTGLVTCCFKQLMLLDLIKEAKFHQAFNLINPITLIKIGSEGGLKATQADLEAFRLVMEEAQYDRDFKIITHNDVTIERIGASGGIIDVSNDITQLWKEIYIGLMVPQVLMDGGGDVTYANGGITLDVLRQRYVYFRNLFSSWLRRKIFAPICKIQEFYENRGGKKVLIVPEVEWNHMSLFDTMDYVQILKDLISPQENGTRELATQTLYRSLGLDWKDEVRRKKEEAIQRAIETREAAVLGKMTLNELKSLDPDGDIEDLPEEVAEGQAEAPLPGESPEAMSLPGLEMPAAEAPAGGSPPPSPPAAPTPPV